VATAGTRVLREDGTIGLLSDGSIALHPAEGSCDPCCQQGPCYRCGTHDVARGPSWASSGSDKWPCSNPSDYGYGTCRLREGTVHRPDKVCSQSSSAKSITAGNWDASEKHVTQSGRFSTYSWQSGDRLLVTSGTGVILGWYDVVARIDPDTIQIDGDLTEDLEYPFSGGMWLEAWKQLAGASNPFAEYSYKAGDTCVIESGTNVTPGTYDVAVRLDPGTIELVQSIGSDSFAGDIVGKVVQKVDITDDSIVGTIYRASTGWSVCSCEGKSYYIASGSWGPENTSAELIESVTQGQWRIYSKDWSPYDEPLCCCGTEYLLGRDTYGPGAYLGFSYYGWYVELEQSQLWCGESTSASICDGEVECECVEESWVEDSYEVAIYYPRFTIYYSSCSCQFELRRFAKRYAVYSHPDDVEFETLYFSAAGVVANEGVIEFTIPCPWYPDYVNDTLQAKLEGGTYPRDCNTQCDRCEVDFASGSIAVKFIVNILMVDAVCDEFVESPE